VTKRRIKNCIGIAVIVFAIGCVIWPLVPYVLAWWVLFESWKFACEMSLWHSFFG